MTYTARKDGFYPVLNAWSEKDIRFDADNGGIDNALKQERLSPGDFAALLSPAASPRLEEIAVRAQAETLKNFGRAVQFFAPLYMANICTNRCVYCGFHAGQKIERIKLTDDEIDKEAKAIADTGLRRVLLLTGDAPATTGATYIANGIRVVSKYIPSVSVEVQALEEEEYALLCQAGCEKMTMFQETYDENLYATLHPAGPKRNFHFRLDAPQRAILGGMRGITFGALLGLTDWRKDIFMTAMHADWLSRKFPHIEIAVSLPRIRPRSEDGSKEKELGYSCYPVNDRDFVQALVAFRCFLPHCGITISTRERAEIRDNIIPLGVTQVSAGVHTSVGGYAKPAQNGPDAEKEKRSPQQEAVENPVQFVIDDNRSVAEMAEAVTRLGYQPVFADWLLPEKGTQPITTGIAEALGVQGQAI